MRRLRRQLRNSARDTSVSHATFPKATSIKDAVAQVLEHFGRLDAVHNNAGIAHPAKPLHETSESEWNAVVDINLKSVFHTKRHGVCCTERVEGLYPQHLVLFNHIALGHESLLLEHIPHLSEHFLHPCRVEDGVYQTPQEPGMGADLL